jgi:hypothetical protein
LSLLQVNGCLSCRHGVSLGVLLPHLAGVAVEAAEVAGGRVRIWARAGAEGASCPGAASSPNGCTAPTNAGWPTRRPADSR